MVRRVGQRLGVRVSGDGYGGGREGRVEVGVEAAGELVDLVDEDLHAVVAANDQCMRVVCGPRTASQAVLAPLAADRVEVGDDHVDAVHLAANVRTEHHHEGRVIAQILRGLDGSVTQQFDVPTATFQRLLKPHLILQNQVLLSVIDGMVEQTRDTITSSRLLCNQRTITVQRGLHKAISPNPRLSLVLRLFAHGPLSIVLVVSLKCLHVLEFALRKRNCILLLAVVLYLLCIIYRTDSKQNQKRQKDYQQSCQIPQNSPLQCIPLRLQ